MLQFSRAGRGLIVFSIAVYAVMKADDSLYETGRKVSINGAGIAGAWAGGAVTGLLCGPGAQVYVFFGGFCRWCPCCVGNEWTVEIRMKLTNEISLQVIKEANQFKESECEVLQNGKITDVKVSGKVLEASIKIDDGVFILFTTDDVIFEESLNIFLIKIGKGDRVVDSAFIGEMYSTGIFKDLTIISSDSVEFYFMGDNAWRVTIYKTPKFRIPSISEDNRVFRRISFKRYFSVEVTI